MDVAIPIFDRLNALDAVGPYEVLSRLPGATVSFIAAETGPRRTENGMLALTADKTLDELPSPEVIMVPGGYGTRPLLGDETLLSWLRGAHRTLAVDYLGVYGIAATGRGRDPRWTEGHDSLAGARRCCAPMAPRPSRSEWSSRAR